ncbi:MAG: pyrimidine 5'-nucleotidase [Rhodospirillaceae bacterium]|nr:pyrimidine 5'-nucleotidase [Rhodospirillaceae bacterium]MDG1273170.1 pyrimidine 5'-nucleotidase [Alphaproteobacteria bacterium]MDG1886388.1 pyrimidine 5'-nucleotidase [Alphaproteobacteria bacterium]|tara:strand:+ start:213 stop:875 length:663 start_codon:yes stop_codon:yes gene_type:complete
MALKIENIDNWIFDLDNTLYPEDTNLFARVSKRMTVFIQKEFNLEEEPARDLQRKMFKQYGTTMRGLMTEYDMDPENFLHFVHDIDVSDMQVDMELKDLLGKLPGRRFIYTNGSVAHAKNITSQLGIENLFEDVFDIVASNFLPKPAPQPYDDMVIKFSADPTRSVMIEDMAKNLRPAADLGMMTVWLRHNKDWSSEDSEGDHIHYAIDDLKLWLKEIIN